MTSYRAPLLIGLLGAVVALAGIGVAPAGATLGHTAAKVTACDLVSLTEAQSGLPVPLTLYTNLTPGYDPDLFCTYYPVASRIGYSPSVTIHIIYRGRGAQRSFDERRAADERSARREGGAITDVATVGNHAYHYSGINGSTGEGYVGAVVLVRGDHVVEVSVRTDMPPGADDQAAETRLAKLIASRLPAPPPAAATKTPERSSLPGAFPDPTKVDTSAKALGASAGLTALLMLMLAFPSQLFDRTLKAHYRTVRGWFGPVARLDQRVAATVRAWPQWVGFSAFMVAGGLLAALLDPTLDWNLASLALVLGLVASRAVVTVAFALPEVIFMRHRHQLKGRFDALPGALAFAAACVVVSRVAGFQPGYLYGVIVGIEFARKLPRDEEGRVAAWAAAWVLGLSLSAWFAWIPVVDAISGGDTSFPILFVDAVLATIFVTGIETVVIGLLPLQVLKGEVLFAWSRRAWGALYAVGAFLFVWVLIHPQSDFVGTTHEGGQVTRAMVPFLFFGAMSIGLWLSLRNRPPSPLEPKPATGGAPTADDGTR